MRRSVRDSEQWSDLAHRQVRPSIDRDQQRPLRQRQRLRPARPSIRDLIAPTLGHQPDQPAELPWLQPRERGDPRRVRRCDHLYYTDMADIGGYVTALTTPNRVAD